MKPTVFFTLLFFTVALTTISSQGREYTNYMHPGTTWEVKIFIPPYPPIPSSTEIEIYSVIDTVVDDKACLKVINENNGRQKALLHIDGEKVWIKSDPYPEWNLLYDYGLQPGEDCVVAVKEYDFLSNIRYKSEGYFDAYPDIPYLDVYEQIYEDFQDYENPTIRWIPGIGSAWGLFQNCGECLVGDIGSKLLKVESDGKIVFATEDYDPNYVDYTETKPAQEPVIYDMMGHKLKAIPGKGLYIINGKKTLIK